MSSVARKILAEKGFRVEFVVLGDENGEDMYAYVIMLEKNYDEFAKKMERGDIITLEDYGTVLLKGKGNKPSKQHKEAVELFFNNWLKET